jgi:hypothetical protein
MGWPGEVNDTNSNKSAQQNNDAASSGTYNKFLAQATEAPILQGDGGGFEDTNAPVNTNNQSDTSYQADGQYGNDSNYGAGSADSANDKFQVEANSTDTIDPKTYMQPVASPGSQPLPKASETGSYSYDNKEKLFKLTLTERRPDSVTNRFFENEIWGGIGGALSVLPKKIWNFGKHSLDFLKKTDEQHLAKQEAKTAGVDLEKELEKAKASGNSALVKLAQEELDAAKAGNSGPIKDAARNGTALTNIPKELEEAAAKQVQSADKLEAIEKEAKEAAGKLRVLPDFAAATKGVKWFMVPSAIAGTAIKSAFAEGSFLRSAGIGMGWAGAGQTFNDLVLYNAFRPESVLKEGLRLPGQPRDYVFSMGIPYALFANLSMAGRLKAFGGTVFGGMMADWLIKPVPKEELAYNHFMQQRGLEASAVGGAGASLGAFMPGNWMKYLLVLPTALAAKAMQQAATDPLKVHDKDYGTTLRNDVHSPSDDTAHSALKDLKEFAVKGGTGSMEVLDRLATRSIPDVRSSAITHTATADAKFEVGTRVKRNAAPVSPWEATVKTIWHSFTGAYDNHSLDSMLIADPTKPDVRMDFGAGATIDYLIAKNAAQTSHDKGSDLPADMQKHIDKRLDFLFDGKGADPADDSKLVMATFKQMVELTRSKNIDEALNQAKRNEELIKALLIQDPQMRHAEVSGWVGRHEGSIIDRDRLAIENTQGLTPEQIKELRVQAILEANQTSSGKLVAKLCRDQAILHMARAYNNGGPHNEYASDGGSVGDAINLPWGAKECLQVAFKNDPESIYNAQLQKIATDLFGLGDLSKMPEPKRSNFGSSSDGPHYGSWDNTSNNAGLAELKRRDQRLRSGGRANPTSGEVQQPEFSPAPEQDWAANARRRQEAEQQNSNIRRYEPKPRETDEERRRREAEEYDRNMLNNWQHQSSNDGFMKQSPSPANVQDPGFEQ